MSFTTPDFQSIRDAILRDILNQRPEANVSADGDYYLRANATGASVEGLYQHQQWIARQIFPDTSDSDILERHASLRRLKKKSATLASGTITFSGTVGSPVLVGTEAKTNSGLAFVTTSSDVIGAGGAVSIAAQASATGTDSNQAAGTALTLTSAPAGVLSSATIASMSGGTDAETDASLLSRLLFVLRNPPCGGASHDYYTWAMNVDGVTAAYVYPLRRGMGTVDVAVMTVGGIPGAALVASVQDYIDTQRPVQGDCLVLAPTAVPVNIAAALTLDSGYTATSVQSAIDTALGNYFASLKPGDTAYLHRLRSCISGTEGVMDYAISAPATNTATLVDSSHVQLATLGSLTWS